MQHTELKPNLAGFALKLTFENFVSIDKLEIHHPLKVRSVIWVAL